MVRRWQSIACTSSPQVPGAVSGSEPPCTTHLPARTRLASQRPRRRGLPRPAALRSQATSGERRKRSAGPGSDRRYRGPRWRAGATLGTAGYPVILGSRDGREAHASASLAGVRRASRVANRAAAARPTFVVTVPWATQQSDSKTFAAVTGKLVVDTTVPLVPPKVMRVQLPPRARQRCGRSRHWGRGDGGLGVPQRRGTQAGTAEPVDCDVLVFGD